LTRYGFQLQPEDGMEQIPAGELERTMKVQKVILRAMGKKITWWQAVPGMLLHIDGSHHQWFCDGRWYDLLVILDDATSEIYYAQLVEDESTRTVMVALRYVVEQRGLFCAIYSNRAGHFFSHRKPAVRSTIGN
jgi:hypothetical protein